MELATNTARKQSQILKLTYLVAVVIDSLLFVYNTVAFIIVQEKGADCYINENKNFPYTRAMIDDPENFSYASDPKPANVHYEVKTVLLVFGVAFLLNIISDGLKLCIPIDTGCKR